MRRWSLSPNWPKRHITTNDLLGLRVGDIIASEKDVQQPLVVYVEGRPKFYATPGKYKGRKAICVLDDIQERQPTRPFRRKLLRMVDAA